MEMPVLRPPLPSQSQWSISEDALHQLRWPRGSRGWVGVGAGPEPLSAPPPLQSGSLVELDPSRFSCHLSPPWPHSDALLFAEVCGCQKGEYGRWYLLWFVCQLKNMSVGSTVCFRKKKMRSQQTREAVTGWGWGACLLASSLKALPQSLGPQSPLKTLSTPHPQEGPPRP